MPVSGTVSAIASILLFCLCVSTGYAADRINLNGVKVKANTELPKVLYIIPWKQAPVGDLVGKPVESLLDETLSSIDRNIFLREVSYYESLREYDRKNHSDDDR